MNVYCQKDERFIRSFIISAMKQRLRFELSRPQYRIRGICRFCHDAQKLIKPTVIYRKDAGLSADMIKEELGSLLELQCKCYVISYYPQLDGQTMRINEALAQCIGRGMPSILLVSERAAVIETEQESGPATKYILYRK